MRMSTLGRTGRLVALAASAVVVTTAGVVLASDHQDTPEVELNPRLDVNDVRNRSNRLPTSLAN